MKKSEEKNGEEERENKISDSNLTLFKFHTQLYHAALCFAFLKDIFKPSF
jgi:hypothetical protein